jgi:uncharacterized protein with NRDE domain
MCLIALAWRATPDWPLVVVANRDEFHARPTAPLHRWAEPSHILAGQDLQAGGLWLGVSEQGRLVALTNVRQASPPTEALLSRGQLGVAMLTKQPIAPLEQYGACNVLLLEENTLFYLTNRNPGAQQPVHHKKALESGVYGLSNGVLDAPWPKTVRLRQALARWLQTSQTATDAPLWHALQDDYRAPDDALPNTGIPLERERLLSPAFIRSVDYGTRASTLIKVDAMGNGTIEERRFGPNGTPLGQTHLHFSFPL